MLDFELKVVDTNDPKVRRAFTDPRIKSRGILALLAKIWFIKNSPAELSAIVEAFSGFSGKREDLILSAVNYLKTAGGVSAQLWKQVEKRAVERGLLTRGGYMDIRQEIKEEGIQEGLQAGRQEGMQAVALNMLKEKADLTFISKVTGWSIEEINRLKNGS